MLKRERIRGWLSRRTSYWPQEILGPKLLTREEAIEHLLVHKFFSTDVSTFQEGIDIIKQNLTEEKTELNTLYSKLQRLNIYTERHLMYEAYVKKVKAENAKIEKQNRNIKKNVELYDDLRAELPKTFPMSTYKHFILCEEHSLQQILDEPEWMNGAYIVLNNRIESCVSRINSLNKTLKTTITKYNKLKNKLLK